MTNQPAPTINPVLLSKVLQQEHRPTEQQADIIGADPGPMLVVAGAGAGKTETMAARVVWLVANGYARPEEVLGLTFTRKAAQELNQRIRTRLATLAQSPKLRDIDPTGEIARTLENIVPHVTTYDAYAGELIREYGLLVPTEPSTNQLTKAQMHALVHEVVTDYTGELSSATKVDDTVEKVITLLGEIDSNLMHMDEVFEQADIFEKNMYDVPVAGKKPEDYFAQTVQKWLDTNTVRKELLPVAAEVKRRLRRDNATTFAEQMSLAARMAKEHTTVGASQRSRYRVVMLDEYQDTSHPQRILLRSLFGGGMGQEDPERRLTVTAVGDPMQAIYGWRGATEENLHAFVSDFPQADGSPAFRRQLTTSWRNPGDVLRMANVVSDAVLGTGDDRPVAPLEPRDNAGSGTVRLGYFSDAQQELDFVASTLAQRYAEQGSELSAAVLCRKSKFVPGIAAALAERGVPYEITNLAGLINVPEVRDILSLATMLVRPQASSAALRVLSGPMVGLSVADLEVLLRRVRNLTGEAQKTEEDVAKEPVARMRSQIAEILQRRPDMVFGLADAVADLGEHERYSAEGLERLHDLAARLRHLRSYSLHKSYVDVFADIDSMFGIRTEVLARGEAHGSAQLDRFMDIVADFGSGSLDSLLDFFNLAEDYDRGLDKTAVAPKKGAVQLSTIHSSKGLEWDTVCVIHQHAGTHKAKVNTFLTNPQLLVDEECTITEEAENRSKLSGLGKAYTDERRADVAAESERLFYVALTRAAKELVVTASAGESNPEPYEHFAAMAQAAPECVHTWDVDVADDEDKKNSQTTSDNAGALEEKPEESGLFPQLHVPVAVKAGADAVRKAMQQLPERTAGETYDFWEVEANALIEEYRALETPVVEVEQPKEMTASDMVALARDPDEFARRRRRPVPFKPNRYAKRGTAFHSWLEERFAMRPLLAEDELPGFEEEITAEELENLKARFLESQWADRSPEYVEQAFEYNIDSTVLRGRMDAVFDEGDHWLVVDWKTGRKPQASEMKAARLQLAVYAEGWRRVSPDDRPVKAAFHYISSNETYFSDTFGGADELSALLNSAIEDAESAN